MTIYEKYRSCSVMVRNGTGVLFQPKTKDYTYVFTARHNIEDENKNILSIREIEIKKYDNTTIEVEHVYERLDIELDIVLIKVEYLESFFTPYLYLDEISDSQDFYFYGFPRTRRTEIETIRPFKLELIDIQSNNNVLVMHNTHGTPQSEIVGCSGGGVFLRKNDDLYLVGIEYKMDDESRREESNTSVNTIKINMFKEIISENSDALVELLPPFLLSFKNLLDEIFLLDDLIIKKELVRNTLLEIVDNNINLEPTDVLEIIEGYILTSMIKSDSSNKLLWATYLEFLVFCSLIKDIETLDGEALININAEYKYLFGKAKSWTGLIPKVTRSNLKELKSGGTIFIACESTSPSMITEASKEMLIDITTSQTENEWNIDQGIENPYEELNIKSIFHIQKKIMENQTNFTSCTAFTIKGNIKNAIN